MNTCGLSKRAMGEQKVSQNNGNRLRLQRATVLGVLGVLGASPPSLHGSMLCMQVLVALLLLR